MANAWFAQCSPSSTRRAGRDAEGIAVPLERLERLQIAKPIARHAVVGDAHFAPADFAHRVYAHFAAERTRHELPAEAVSDDRNVTAHGIAQELEKWRNPRQVVVGAHRATHEADARKFARVARHCLAGIERD